MDKNIIYCPECARELYRVSQRQTIKITKLCKCGRYFKIDPINRSAVWVNKPQRESSSGITFY